MTPALELRGLVKRFGSFAAVNHLDLQVPAGSFYGLVGPNGAGKTTALSMAVGLLPPDAGRALVLGHDMWADPARAKMQLGVLPDGLQLPEALTGPELLTYLGLLAGLPKATVRARAAELLEVLGLSAAASTLVGDYSTGMRKKVGLAAALLHAPRVLVLDEPFEAVDPLSARRIRSILQGFVAGGGTVLLSSHVMPLVEDLCDHVAIIAGGQVRASGQMGEVRQGRRLEDVFLHLVGEPAAVEGELAWLRA